MAPSPPPPHRAEVEYLVRRALYQRMGKNPPRRALAPNPLVVNVRARHCHLTPAAVETLFGKGATLAPAQSLYQRDQFVAKETVTLVGPLGRVISNLRILGPCRNYNQVELARTDAIALGFEIPIRSSGSAAGTPGCTLLGPAGSLQMNEGVIRAAPHAHMHPDDAAFYKVKGGDFVHLKVGGQCATTFDRVLVRVHADFKLEVHIDTDEGNACALEPNTPVELIP
jgi:putative phosphotransacetylase